MLVAILKAWKTWAIFLVLSSWKHVKIDSLSYFVVFIGLLAMMAFAIFFAPFNWPYLSKIDIISSSLPLFTFLWDKYYLRTRLSWRRVSHIQIFILKPRKPSLRLQMVTIKAKISKNYIKFIEYFIGCNWGKISISYMQSFPFTLCQCWLVMNFIIIDNFWIKIKSLTL